MKQPTLGSNPYHLGLGNANLTPVAGLALRVDFAQRFRD